MYQKLDRAVMPAWGYRTTHGTEPTLGSILWRCGTRRPESGALVAALAYDPLSCALLLFAAVMGAVLLHLVCLHAHTLPASLATRDAQEVSGRCLGSV